MLRLLTDEDRIEYLGEGPLPGTLRLKEWTHEAHFAATVWLIQRHPELELERDLRKIISHSNEAVGIANTDSGGHHETITQVYLAAVRAHLAESAADEPLIECVNALPRSEYASRGWPLRTYSKGLQNSVATRHRFGDPDRE